MNDITKQLKKWKVTEYAFLGLIITLLGFLVNIIIGVIDLFLSDVASINSVLGLGVLVFTFVLSLFLLGVFAKPILGFFGYKLVKK